MTKRRRTQKQSQQFTSSQIDVAALQSALDEATGNRWLKVLELFLPTGVADTGQIRAVTGLSYDQLDAFLRCFHDLTSDEILARIPFNVPRPGVRGRPPTVYKLGGTGATLLRANGYPDAHACGLNCTRTIAHARAILDVHLAAQAAGLSVQTERELSYTTDGEVKVLRPDNLITLPDGTQALFEIEQSANLTLLWRIRDGLRRRVAFFNSEAAAAVSSTIRVLINLPRGRMWDKTIGVWERATAIVAEEQGGKLPFRIVALPLQEFLGSPDWSEPPDAQRWESLFDPSQVVAFGPAHPRVERRKGNPPAQRSANLPQGLRRRSAADDRRILQAYWQHFLELGPELAYTAKTPRPDPAFFEIMQIIYTAAHPPDASLYQQATHPYASIYLLRSYLDMHPRLRDALSKRIVRGSGSIRWNSTAVLHRVQVVIRVFLKYHGWAVSGPLQTYPVVPSWDSKGPRDLRIEVRIHPDLLMEEQGDGVVPGKEEVRQAEESLAWVLWALFAYGDEVMLKTAVFW